MPGFVHTSKDEARWERAKTAAGKSTQKDSTSYWKLSNYIYHKMGKSETDASNAQITFDTMDESEKKLAKDFYVSQGSFQKSEDSNNVSTENYSTFSESPMGATQSIRGKEVTQMSEEKKYSAREAAIAVLQKAEEMLKANGGRLESLKKGELPPKTAEGQQDETPKDGVQAEPNATEEVPRNGNPDWGTDPGKKGYIKLAKFCGHVEAKRKAPKPGVSGAQ